MGESIEGIPVIIRFKTELVQRTAGMFGSIEGIPVIIRFKTPILAQPLVLFRLVLKVFQL